MQDPDPLSPEGSCMRGESCSFLSFFRDPTARRSWSIGV